MGNVVEFRSRLYGYHLFRENVKENGTATFAIDGLKPFGKVLIMLVC